MVWGVFLNYVLQVFPHHTPRFSAPQMMLIIMKNIFYFVRYFESDGKVEKLLDDSLDLIHQQ